ncbi:MAG: hypothetical protein U0930_03955 [Pirellulales bacterium]
MPIPTDTSGDRSLSKSTESPATQSTALESTTRAIPLWLKVAYTLFVSVLVPYYWIAYGPTNFLFFCDVALFLTLASLWLESALLASMAGVGILLPQALWMADFLGTAVGLPLTGMTGYMFDSKYTLFVRGLSFFHFWLPILLVWMIWRMGYDRRAFLAWTILAWALLFVCYFLMPAPPAPSANPDLIVNINYVYGFSDKEPQTWMPPLAWFAALLAVLPLGIYLPTHLILSKLLGTRRIKTI